MKWGVLTPKNQIPVPCAWYSSLSKMQSGGGGDGLCKEVDEVNWVLEGGELEIEQGRGFSPKKLNTSTLCLVFVPIRNGKKVVLG